MFENVVSLEKMFSLRGVLSVSGRKNRTRGPDKQYLEGLKIPDRSQQVAKSYPDSAGNVFCSRPRYVDDEILKLPDENRALTAKIRYEPVTVTF